MDELCVERLENYAWCQFYRHLLGGKLKDVARMHWGPANRCTLRKSISLHLVLPTCVLTGKLRPYQIRLLKILRSLFERDVGPAAENGHTDSPMWMTSTGTTLMRGIAHHHLIGLERHRVRLCHAESTSCFFGAICGGGPIAAPVNR